MPINTDRRTAPYATRKTGTDGGGVAFISALGVVVLFVIALGFASAILA